MRKGILLGLALLFGTAFSSNIFAAEGPLGLTGIGVYGSFGTTMGGGVGLSLKWGSFPVIGLKYNLADNGGMLNVSADYYVIDAEGLARNLSYFLGAGLYTGFSGNNLQFGLRVPVGLQFWPVRKFELYLSPVVSIPLLPTPSLDFGAELGARIRF